MSISEKRAAEIAAPWAAGEIGLTELPPAAWPQVTFPHDAAVTADAT